MNHRLKDKPMQTKSKQSNFNPAKNAQRGITLIELMVAMAVSSIIMLGISNIYLSTKKSHVIHDEFARLQENIRYAGNTLALEIRNSGYFGCAAGQNPDSIKNGLVGSENIALNLETGIFGFDADDSDIGNNLVFDPTVQGGVQANWRTAAGLNVKTQDPITGAKIKLALNPNIDPLVLARAIPGSDILILRGAIGTGINVAKQNTGAQVFLDDTTGLQVGACSHNPPAQQDGISGLCPNDILMLTDCESARIFKVTSLNQMAGGPGACGGTLPCINLKHAASGSPSPGDNKTPVAWSDKAAVFKEDAEVMKVVTKTFFIGLPDPVPGGAPPEPTLYVQNNDNTPLPLVEGVENMQVLYGVDTDIPVGGILADGDGIANQYFSAHNVPDLDNPNANNALDNGIYTIFEGIVSVKLSLLVRTPQDMPGVTRTAADYANLIYPMISPVAPITVDPIPADAASTDRRMRKVHNLTIKLRNK